MTRRRLTVIGALLLVLLLAGLAGRAVLARRDAAATATAAAAGSAPAGAARASGSGAGTPGSPSANGALELAAEDVLVLAAHELSRGVALSGSLKAVNTAVLKAKVAGELLELGPREGDTVTAGQTLGRIDATEAELRVKQADHQVEAAQAQVDLARRQLENNRALVGQGFISATSLDASVANDNGARATLQAAQAGADLARKALGDTRLIAPLTGQVSQRLAQPGERLAVDGRVLEIVDLGRLELEATLPAQDAGALRPGAAAQLEVEGITTPVAARIARINPATQAGTRAVMVYLALLPTPAQARGLRNGLFARGVVELARLKVAALPVSAVFVDEVQPYVLLLQAQPDAAGQAIVRRQRVVLGERGQPRDGAVRLPGAPTSAPAPASAPAGSTSSPAATLGSTAAGDSPAGTPEEWVEIRSGLPPGARVLRGSVGQVADGSLALLPAAARASAAASAAAQR